MFTEPSTVASIAYVLRHTLETDYGMDPAPVFAAAGKKVRRSFEPGERITLASMNRLWECAVEGTGDQLVGIRAGRNVKPSHFYAFGHSWLASESLLGAMRRLARYDKIISTESSEMSIESIGDTYAISEKYPDRRSPPIGPTIDFGVSAVLTLCEMSAGHRIRPTQIELIRQDESLIDDYRKAFEAPVRLNAPFTKISFSKADLEAPLEGSIPEVAKATDRISEQYLDALDSSKTAAKVRQLLIEFLPSGNAHQDRIAHSLHRSASTLQRQLQGEGTSYRDVLEDTRKQLARDYLEDKQYSHAQIAYLLGFSDQSNFSRAFKRWTGTGPREYQSALS